MPGFGSKLALVIESDDRTPSGYIGDAALARGFALHRIQVNGDASAFDEAPTPDIIIVPGSDEHWHEIDDRPHLRRELGYLCAAIDAGIPILGMCFGGQALAMALGAEVKPMGTIEIGWFEVESMDPLRLPTGPWFEWHTDEFHLPVGAELLARNDVSLQAFRFGPHLGLQFHPEVGPEQLEPWMEAVPGTGVDPAGLMAATRVHAPAARRRAFDLFDMFLSLDAGGDR